MPRGHGPDPQTTGPKTTSPQARLPELPALDAANPFDRQFVPQQFARRVLADGSDRAARVRVVLPLIGEIQKMPATRATNDLCEQLQAGICKPQKQMSKIEHRLAATETLGLPSTASLRAEAERVRLDLARRAEDAPDTIAEDCPPAFNLLRRVISDVQWGYVRRGIKHDLVADCRVRVYTTFLFALCCFMLGLLLTLALSPISAGDGETALGLHVPNRDTAALIVWSVIAGFSESFVPSLLLRIEKSGGEKS